MKIRFSMGLLTAAALIALALGFSVHAASKATAGKGERASVSAKRDSAVGQLQLTPEQWRARLDDEQFRVLREEGTEHAFTGAYWKEYRSGMFRCAGCGLRLFSSKTKFDSRTGWPSFWKPIAAAHVIEKPDAHFGGMAIEVECARCEGHLGHVFDDGPDPTGLRYCINSASLSFVPSM